MTNTKAALQIGTKIAAYREEAAKKSDFERTELAKDKTGVVLGGITAINPVMVKRFQSGYQIMYL